MMGEPVKAIMNPDLLAQVWGVLKARDARPRPRVEGRPQLEVAEPDEQSGMTDVLVYDEIGYWGITATDVVAALDGIKGPLNVRVNSPGGDVFDGIAIFNSLRDHPGKVTVTVDGLAASAASFIAMAGDTIRMNRASQMMIHDASGLTVGNAQDMREMADLLDRVSDTIAGIYADRTGVDVEQWRARMRAETWYDAAEAVEAGLADEMPKRRRPEPDGDEPENTGAWDLTVFQYAGRRHAPAPLASPLPDQTAVGDQPPPAPSPDDNGGDDWAAVTTHLTQADEFTHLLEAL